MLKTLALALIGFYQRQLSARKGFGCAYRLVRGRASCSHLGARAIRRYGLWRGLAVLDARLGRCGQASAIARLRQPRLRPQHGVCDCSGCDAPGLECVDPGSCLDRLGNVLSCADAFSSCGDCDWRRRDNRARG
jgi:putative component of membrane protein insertase Oxa1/YidC/SpoIIIJ protein YidD